ncbi:hypothetical protein LSH36_102g04000 [Paralvinella palmiformis]|uniref:Borealin n=1 Tax=Paralvinella palmiformis TaxID=53620 RepID=A0AAD9JZN5_9ANNE|nr:hypothetical protein LSH36_102g04000 [Paralvinella palmiformis]
MPRRKVRRAESKRQPKAPNGDEGVDLARDIKAEKLRTLMADFDTHMESFYKSLQDNVRDVEKTIECAYMMAIAKLPKHVREMDLEDYLRGGGEAISILSADQVTKEIEISLAALTKSKKKTKRKGKKSITGSKAKSSIKPQRWKTVTNSAADIMPPPTTMRTIRNLSKRSRLETPAHRGEPSQCGWDTPLITPKFDPRLPITPAMTRRPKVGEIFLSLAGSPIAADVDRSTIVIKKDPELKKTFVVLDNEQLDLDNIEMLNMEQNTKEHLRLLKQKLNALKLSPLGS